MQSDPSSVRILRPSARVSPELIAPTLVPEPELAARCVFGVSLEILREEGQMVSGIPLVLRDMVEFLDKNGNRGTACCFFINFYSIHRSFLLHSFPLFSLALSMQNVTPASPACTYG